MPFRLPTRLLGTLLTSSHLSARHYLSRGFVLPRGARLAPDASWTSRNRFRQRPLCPQFVIELLSPTDRLKKADAKMQEWLANGVELGWLIDPRGQSVSEPSFN